MLSSTSYRLCKARIEVLLTPAFYKQRSAQNKIASLVVTEKVSMGTINQ